MGKHNSSIELGERDGRVVTGLLCDFQQLSGVQYGRRIGQQRTVRDAAGISVQGGHNAGGRVERLRVHHALFDVAVPSTDPQAQLGHAPHRQRPRQR